ncbi:hypothetical protein [Methanofollis ethanolicus]|uniref:hypothetical protein n=1 Tax=Methanofollis ethanolicus TaxID=488124 RepID=UPI00082EEB7C|nr:hypothetical protein [Methanofollis ethanolicus]
MEQRLKKTGRLLLYGALTWLVPLLVAIPFYGPGGGLLVDVFLFKSVMIVVGGVTGALLLVHWFDGVQARHLGEGVTVGGVWLAMNWALDLLVLVPVSGMDIATYFGQIGLRYLLIPTMAIAIGYSTGRAAAR